MLKSCNLDVKQKCTGQKKLTNRVPITTKLLEKRPKYIKSGLLSRPN